MSNKILSKLKIKYYQTKFFALKVKYWSQSFSIEDHVTKISLKNTSATGFCNIPIWKKEFCCSGSGLQQYFNFVNNLKRQFQKFGRISLKKNKMDHIISNQSQYKRNRYAPPSATSLTSTFFSLAMNPSMEKITKPAKMDVAQFMTGTRSASLKQEE